MVNAGWVINEKLTSLLSSVTNSVVFLSYTDESVYVGNSQVFRAMVWEQNRTPVDKKMASTGSCKQMWTTWQLLLRSIHRR